MNEEKILAENNVYPKLKEFGFTDDQITSYDTYTIHFGTKTFRIDYLCWIIPDHIPYVVVEVKTDESKFDFHQVESYALHVKSPFFILTDSNKWLYYLTGNSPGSSMEINSLPMPVEMKTDDFQQINLKDVDKIKEFIESVFSLNDPNFKSGLEWHYNSLAELEELLTKLEKPSIKSISKILFSDALMPDKRNVPLIKEAINNNPEKVFDSLKHLINNEKPLSNRYDDLINPKSEYKIPGVGVHTITRLLSAIDYNCFTINPRVINKLAELNVIQKRNRNLTGFEYEGLVKRLEPLKDHPRIKDHGMDVIHYCLWKADQLDLNNE